MNPGRVSHEMSGIGTWVGRSSPSRIQVAGWYATQFIITLLWVSDLNLPSSVVDAGRFVGFGRRTEGTWRHATPTLLKLPAMTLNSTDGSTSFFKYGKLKPGIYKIQNLESGTFLDVHHHSKQVCGRPAEDLVDGEGLVRLSPGPVVAHLTIKSGRSTALGPDTPYGWWA